MEKDVLAELHMKDREEAVRFLKKLWSEKPTSCPKCGNILDELNEV